MFSCEAQLFLRFLALGFRNLPLYPGPEKRSFLSKMSQKPSPCTASTQPKTKPEDISASFPVENRIPPPPRKTDSDISKVKKACCPTCPAARAPGAGDVQACRKLFPRTLFATASREPYRFARRLICPVTHAPSAKKQHTCSCRFPDDAQDSGKARRLPPHPFQNAQGTCPSLLSFKETAASRSRQRLSEKLLSRQTPRQPLLPCPTARAFQKSSAGNFSLPPRRNRKSPFLPPSGCFIPQNLPCFTASIGRIRHPLKTAKGMPLSGHPFRLFLSA